MTLSEDISNQKVKEDVEDLIKRINTRIKLIKDNDTILRNLNDKYDLDNVNLDEELKKSNLI